MHFDFFVSNDSVASYSVHRKTTFFRGASGDLLSLAQFSIFCNENLDKYCANVALLYKNWLNELTLSVSPKKILKNMPFFHRIPPPPPPNRILVNRGHENEALNSLGRLFSFVFFILLFTSSDTILVSMKIKIKRGNRENMFNYNFRNLNIIINSNLKNLKFSVESETFRLSRDSSPGRSKLYRLKRKKSFFIK